MYSNTSLAAVVKTKVELVNEMLAQPGFISKADRLAIELLARNLAKVEMIDRWLQIQGLFTKTGEPQPVLREYSRLVNSANRLLNDLGLTPRARGELSANLSRLAKSGDLASAILLAKEGIVERKGTDD
jgi:phage terminase small subunit